MRLIFVKAFTSCLLLFIFLNTTMAQTRTITEKVDDLFAEWNKEDAPGCVIAVVKSGKVIYTQNYGMANLEHDIPLSSKSVFRIASTSKQFTAAAVLLLAQKGKLSLDDDIRKYFPELKNYGKKIKVRHLIHHTSGIRDYLELAALKGYEDYEMYTKEDVLNWLSRQEGLNFDPNEEYLYSNSGYFLLGQLVERVSGKSLRDFAAKEIFEPLEMYDTHFHDDHTEIVKNRASGYLPKEDGGFAISMTNLELVGDGGVFTTLDDLVKWDENSYFSAIGRSDFNYVMEERGVLNNGDTLNYAFGLDISDYKGIKMVSHGGAFVGFRAEMLRFPSQGFSVICLSNLGTFDPTEKALAIADLYLSRALSLEKPEKETPTASDETATSTDSIAVADDTPIITAPLTQEDSLEQYVGTYEIKGAFVIHVNRDRDLLSWELVGQGTYDLQPNEEKEATFYMIEAPVSVTFSKIKDGKSFVATIDQGGSTMVADRRESVYITAEVLESYTGDYYSNELETMYSISRKGEDLYCGIKGKEAIKMGTLNMDEFTFNFGKLVFKRDPIEAVAGFELSLGRTKGLKFVKK